MQIKKILKSKHNWQLNIFFFGCGFYPVPYDTGHTKILTHVSFQTYIIIATDPILNTQDKNHIFIFMHIWIYNEGWFFWFIKHYLKHSNTCCSISVADQSWYTLKSNSDLMVELRIYQGGIDGSSLQTITYLWSQKLAWWSKLPTTHLFSKS